MSRSEKCISPPDSPASPDTASRGTAPRDPAPREPDVCAFRHLALLHVPRPCRRPLRHLGNLFFDWSMETFGIAPEEEDSEGITLRRMEALGEDLQTAGEQLAALGREPEGSEMGRVERELCEQAGRLAPTVLRLAAELRSAAAET